MQSQIKLKLVDSGNSVFPIRYQVLKDLGVGKRMVPFNNRVQVATKIPVKILGKKEYLVKLKPKQLKFVHNFLITQKSISHIFLNLYILTDKELQNWLKEYYFVVETY